MISILDAFVEPPLVIASITDPSRTSLVAEGSTEYFFPADPDATWLIAALLQATPSISKVIAAVPVVVALLCAKILIILPPSGTFTNVDDDADTSGIADVKK